MKLTYTERCALKGDLWAILLLEQRAAKFSATLRENQHDQAG